LEKLKTLFLALVLILLAVSCNKSNNQNTGTQDIFPNKIGDSWHYLVKDTTIQGNLDSGSIQYDVDVLIFVGDNF
jgi:hypothetical protein